MSLGSTWTVVGIVFDFVGVISIFTRPNIDNLWPIPWYYWIIASLVLFVIGVIETNFIAYRELENKTISLLEVAPTNLIKTREYIVEGRKEALIHDVILYLKNPNEQEKTVKGIGVTIISDNPKLKGKKIRLSERPPYRKLNLDPGHEANIIIVNYTNHEKLPFFLIPCLDEYGDTSFGEFVKLEISEEYSFEFMVTGEDLSAKAKTLIFGMKNGQFYAHWKHLMTPPVPCTQHFPNSVA